MTWKIDLPFCLQAHDGQISHTETSWWPVQPFHSMLRVQITASEFAKLRDVNCIIGTFYNMCCILHLCISSTDFWNEEIEDIRCVTSSKIQTMTFEAKMHEWGSGWHTLRSGWSCDPQEPWTQCRGQSFCSIGGGPENTTVSYSLAASPHTCMQAITFWNLAYRIFSHILCKRNSNKTTQYHRDSTGLKMLENIQNWLPKGTLICHCYIFKHKMWMLPIKIWLSNINIQLIQISEVSKHEQPMKV